MHMDKVVSFQIFVLVILAGKSRRFKPGNVINTRVCNGVHLTALRAAVAAFKREEQRKQEESKQVDVVPLRSKRRRESGELLKLTKFRKSDKVFLFGLLT